MICFPGGGRLLCSAVIRALVRPCLPLLLFASCASVQHARRIVDNTEQAVVQTGNAMDELRTTVAVVRTEILPRLSKNLDSTDELLGWVRENILPLGTLACAMLLWGLRKKIAAGLLRVWRGRSNAHA